MALIMSLFNRHYQEPPPQNLQPTFEDLSIDDNLSELQRLVRYSRSAIGLQRYVVPFLYLKLQHMIDFAFYERIW